MVELGQPVADRDFVDEVDGVRERELQASALTATTEANKSAAASPEAAAGTECATAAGAT